MANLTTGRVPVATGPTEVSDSTLVATGDGSTFAELDLLANVSGTLGVYLYVDATGGFVGANADVPGLVLQVKVGGYIEVQANAVAIARIAADGVSLPALQPFADDAAAAAGGVPVTGLYRTGSAVKQRVT